MPFILKLKPQYIGRPRFLVGSPFLSNNLVSESSEAELFPTMYEARSFIIYQAGFEESDFEIIEVEGE